MYGHRIYLCERIIGCWNFLLMPPLAHEPTMGLTQGHKLPPKVLKGQTWCSTTPQGFWNANTKEQFTGSLAPVFYHRPHCKPKIPGVYCSLLTWATIFWNHLGQMSHSRRGGETESQNNEGNFQKWQPVNRGLEVTGGPPSPHPVLSLVWQPQATAFSRQQHTSHCRSDSGFWESGFATETQYKSATSST